MYRAMMGEYILYYNGKIAAYLCDDRLPVKPISSAVKMLPGARCEPPYDGVKDMLLVENVDDREFFAALFRAMEPELPTPGKRKQRRIITCDNYENKENKHNESKTV